MAAIVCPKCADPTSVTDSRMAKYRNIETQRRRRLCLNCGHRFSTVEVDRDVFDAMVKVAGKYFDALTPEKN